MRHVSQNGNQNVYGTGLTFGKIDPLEQALVRLLTDETQPAAKVGRPRQGKSGRTLIGQRLCDFVSPGEPAGHEFARVKFEPGTGTSPLKELADHVGFLAMATPRSYQPATQTEVIEPIILASNRRQ